MQIHALPASLILLILSTTSTIAAPLASTNCRSISFLSPRYQSILGIRGCHTESSAFPSLDLSHITPQEDAPVHKKRDYIWGPPNEFFPIEEFKRQAEKLKHIDIDLKLDLALLKDSLRRGKGLKALSRPSEASDVEQPAVPGHFREMIRKSWSETRRLLRAGLDLVSRIDEQIVILAVIAFVCACWIIAGVEIYISHRKLATLQKKQARQMKRVIRRGTKVRIRNYPFCLATIDEEKGMPLYGSNY